MATRLGSGTRLRYDTDTPVAELYSQPETGIAIISTYIRTCTANAARACQAGIAAGRGGAGLRMRHASRAAATRKTVMPIHLCHA